MEFCLLYMVRSIGKEENLSIEFFKEIFKYYEQELFPRTLNETINPFLKNGRLDLLDFGYRITMNLTADFAGIDRVKKLPKKLKIYYR